MLPNLDPFRRRSVALALYRMLTGESYDLCVVREALDAAGLSPRRDQLAALRLHHCVRYATLPTGFHAELAEHTLALFHEHAVLGDAALNSLAALAGLDPSSAPPLRTPGALA